MLADNENHLVILGTLDTDTERNIYSTNWRISAIQDIFPDIQIQTLADDPDDTAWCESLAKLLDTYSSHTYTFYCGDRKNDYAIQVIEKHKDVFT